MSTLVHLANPMKTLPRATKPTVYIAMCCDLFHPGHANIIRIGRQLGSVTIGLLTDAAIASYKRTPLLSYAERRQLLREIKGVDRIVPQETLGYGDNLRLLRPDYVVHGDDWKIGVQAETRREVLRVLEEWGGKLVEPRYTEAISSTLLKERLMNLESRCPSRKTQIR